MVILFSLTQSISSRGRGGNTVCEVSRLLSSISVCRLVSDSMDEYLCGEGVKEYKVKCRIKSTH